MNQRESHDMRSIELWLACIIGSASLAVCAGSAEPVAGAKNGPLSPREEQATFHIPKGFKVELIAAEPDVIDPVAMAFDEDGRMFVVEMRGYPNGGVGEGPPVLPGRVKLLEDRDGDGYYETSSVYVDNLRFPTGVTCWRGGIIVADAPDLLYCTNPTAGRENVGRGSPDPAPAAERRVLYTGFGAKNIQQMVNSLQFHFDNWIHGCNGSNESVIKSVEKPDAPPVALRGRHFRFKPDVPASLEPMSGGGQYGMACDDWGNWFTCTNSQHIRHIVLPDHYLKRNPYLAVPAVTHDIPDGVDQHTAAAKLYRISPFEPWRVERTTRRAGSADAARFPSTELVPGGYVTSACGITIYRSWGFGEGYWRNAFVCDPANNLIHRDVLMPEGPTFIAKRGEKDCEFLSSTDTWFRPVFLCEGPDGAIYVCDFYREVIETPLSLPEDIQKKYNLQSRGRGRIWRIQGPDYGKPEPVPRLKMSKYTDTGLRSTLNYYHAALRLSGQRLLIERQSRDPEVRRQLEVQALTHGTNDLGITALWTLDGLGLLDAKFLETILKEKVQPQPSQLWPSQAILPLVESRLSANPELQKIVLELAERCDASARFHLAFTLGYFDKDPRVAQALAKLARKDGANPWHQAAILSSSLPHAAAMLEELVKYDDVAPSFLGKLAGMVAASGDEAAVTQALQAMTDSKDRLTPRRMLVLDGLAQGSARQGKPLARRLAEKNALAEQIMHVFKETRELAESTKSDAADRLAATRLLAHAPLALAGPPLGELLTPTTSSDLQMAAVQTLAMRTEPQAADLLLAGWSGYSPAVRREVQEALFARADRLPALLAAIEKGQVQVSQLDLARREQLLKSPNTKLRERAQKLFAGQVPAERKQVVEDHKKALDLTADAARGKLVFKNNCATCHRLENEGQEVGPDLLSALKTKTKETLLTDILDPSREVDPRYLNYIVAAKSGRTFTGLIASETASSLVVRRAEKAEDTLLRADIEEIKSTGKSLMPEGLEKQMDDQQLADVIAYLLAVARK
jgi:putative membrane-bound dehydrogenase-like protein